MLYLLSEVQRWESSGQISSEQSAQLRATYEARRDYLRRELAARESEDLNQRADAPQTGGPPASPAEQARAEQPAPEAERAERATHEGQFVAFPARRPAAAAAQPSAQSPPALQRPHRTLFERLADPQTLRLLLYTGAAMLVVGVVIWLRDLLYLKLQEPVVQAGLLAFGTAIFTASGWYTILRTRQRWTGRALTIAGSLLVPVNFWFLVRSGLIENHGRAWVVCAFCALLYAHTAAILRERLYVYLACAASIATLWALILRDAPRAYGLYALALMASSLVFLHLSRIFPEAGDDSEAEDEAESAGSRARTHWWSRELRWRAPLARTALVGAILSLILYLPLRFNADASSFYNGIFHLRTSAYDASIALLLLAAAAYVLWFTGRYIYRRWSSAFYTLSTLALFLTIWTACDGFRLTAQAEVLALALATFLVALVARIATSDTLSRPLHHASTVVSLLLAVASISVLLNASEFNATESASLALVAATFATLSAPRFVSHVEQTVLAHFAALYFSAAYFVALASVSLKSETLITALCAAWPPALYGAGQLASQLKREAQLSAPFTRVSDALALLLLLWGGILALLIHLMGGGASRSSVIVALAGVALYGALRARRQQSVYGATLGTAGAVILTAAAFDSLQKLGVWPASWPIAAATIVFAFLLETAGARLLGSSGEAEQSPARPLLTAIQFVLDLTVVVCAILWLTTAFTRLGEGGYGAPSVLLLALLYWAERASEKGARVPVYAACAHMGAFFLTLLIALRVDAEWLDLLFALTIFPTFFILSRYGRARDWLRLPLSRAAATALGLSLLAALLQAAPHLQTGDAHLLAPSLTAGAIALLSFAASIFSRGRASVLYFRTGLWVAVVSLMLASLRAGFDPIEDAEVYSTPIAVLMLIIAYLSLSRSWQEYDRDAGALLWVGSLLLCVPLLMRALEFRLLLDTSAPWRDVAVLIASLSLILYGVVGRMRAPILIGATALIIELTVLTLTSVNWMQVPLKYYLMTVGALLLIIFGTLEYRREQFLLMRKRFQERRDAVREQFSEWR